ncbi:MAG: hypothetical protein VKO21_04485 [Candidatus Sericytochromatia bacterium]|nr:hypothetical protein [Candidatus Sericytochromatia bacterium]
MKSWAKGRPLALAGSFTIGLASLATPVHAADRIDVGGVSGSPATVNGVQGYNVTYDRYLYDKIEFLNVVAYYRAYRDPWLNQELQGGGGLNWGAGEWNLADRDDNVATRANFNQGIVESVVARTNINTLYNYLANVIDDYGNRGQTHASQSQAMLLIDKDTGRLVGHYTVPDSYEARAVMEYVVDSGGASRPLNANVNFVAGGTKNLNLQFAGSSVWSSPIILDLSGTGKPDLLAGGHWGKVAGRKLASAAIRPFDIDGKGTHEFEWIGPKAGLLVWDETGKGRITSGRQLFGNVTWGKTWRHGYQPLATLDKNKDGALTPDEFAKLGVWVDANSNGISEPGEVKTLAAAGFERLDVRAVKDKTGNYSVPGGAVRKGANGKRSKVSTWDWWALGAPAPEDATYVWMSEPGSLRLVGGLLKLRAKDGQLQGASIPTIGVEKATEGLRNVLPVNGTRKADRMSWTVPAPEGTKVTTEVRSALEGKRLFGVTTLETAKGKLSYNWQAELVRGKAITAWAGK